MAFVSKAQAERAAAAAKHNLNAYGQKEEGPSRWQQRLEAKRQMYSCSTERPPTIGVRKDKPSSQSHYICQKCFQIGHWTYECKNSRIDPRNSSSSNPGNPTPISSTSLETKDLLEQRALERRALHQLDQDESKRKEKRKKKKKKETHKKKSRSKHSDSGTESCSSDDSKHKKKRKHGSDKDGKHRKKRKDK